MQVYRYAGVQVCRYTGIPCTGMLLVYWYTGTSALVCRYTDITGILVYWYILVYTGIQVYWYTGIRVHRYTGIQVYWYTGTPVYWYTGILGGILAVYW